MNTDVNKIIDNALGQVRTILVEAVEQVNEDARAELVAKFNQAVVGTQGSITAVKAPRVSAKTSTKTKKTTAKKATAKKAAVGTKKATPKKNKPKRVVSEATRKKLADNLKKARDAKAQKAKAPSKRKTKAKAKKKS